MSGSDELDRTWNCTGRVAVIDPRSARASLRRPKLAGVVSAVTGAWCVLAGITAERCVTSLTTWAAQSEPPCAGEDWEDAGFAVRADSGQCCVLNKESFPRDDVRDVRDASDESDENGFYHTVCEVTTELGAGRLTLDGQAFGVVAATGLGKGVYPVAVRRDGAGLVDAIRVQFLDEAADGEAESQAAIGERTDSPSAAASSSRPEPIRPKKLMMAKAGAEAKNRKKG